jgi:beta-lactamase class D
MPLRHFIVSTLVLMVLVGCGGRPAAPLPSATQVTAVPTREAELDLQTYFQEFAGAFVLYDRDSARYTRYNPERCSERFLPASTFKILNSLIGLETGVIPDENHVIRWDGTKHGIESWNQDHTLKTAIQNSVVWYYQELARRVGKERMQSYIDAVGYGNQDLSGPIEAFWLDGSLQISPDEQVEFLRRLYEGDLPFSGRSMKLVKEILVLERTDRYQLSGKTGSGQAGNLYIGWFVGFLEEEKNVYFFAANIQSSHSNAKGLTAKEITLNILRGLELLP